jgi:hypothetical protein
MANLGEFAAHVRAATAVPSSAAAIAAMAVKAEQVTKAARIASYASRLRGIHVPPAVVDTIAFVNRRTDMIPSLSKTLSIISSAVRVATSGQRWMDEVARVRKTITRARDYLYAGLQNIRSRREQRAALGAELASTHSAQEQLAHAAMLTALAMRLNVNHSPPPRQAAVTTPRKVRGPNTAGRSQLSICGNACVA